MKNIRTIAKENGIEIIGKLMRCKDEFGATTYEFDNGMAWVTYDQVTFAWADETGDDNCETFERR